MIKIELTGMCKGCQHANLELEDSALFFGGDERIVEHQIVCSHWEVCEMWEQKLNDLKANKT